MKRVMTFVILLLCSLSVSAQPIDSIQTWTAPPYWTPPQAALQESGDHGGRDALASGRPALVTSPVPLPFVAVAPCRMVDTRGGAPLTGGFLPAATVRSYTLTGVCNIPADAKAISLNATVTDTAGPGFLVLWPEGGAFPATSTLNYVAGQTVANAAVVPLSTSGGISMALGVSGGDVILDTNGYYSPLGVVNSLNGQAGDLTLVPGTNVTLTPGTGTLTIATAGAPPTGPAGGALTGTYPNPGLAGVFASLGANTFTGTQTISVGNLALPLTTGSTVGVLSMGGQPFLHAYGDSTNTFVGGFAGGGFATTGVSNSAFGMSSLFSNTTGGHNAAFGANSLSLNTTGDQNAAFGVSSLSSNTTSSGNAAFGGFSLNANTTGSLNAAFGYLSLLSNTTGGHNAAFGAQCLQVNTTGNSNAAFGDLSLWVNTTGNNNAAFGAGSMNSNTTGGGNIAIGMIAGSNLTTGNNNIDIGNVGAAAEGNTIRIGTAGNQTRTFIAGISGVTTGAAGVAVLVDANGQLGTISSSRRFKDDIADMDAASSALMSLRPVTFHYKTDQSPSGRTLQYGLIAEEVANVYPELVARSADGQIETVLYQFLPSMLLNEYQKQQRTIEAQAARLDANANELRAQNDALRERIVALEKLQQELLSVLAREKR